MHRHVVGLWSFSSIGPFFRERGVPFRFHRRQDLQLQMSLHQFPQLLPVLILHMHKFHAIPFRPNIPHHRREVNLT